MGRVLQQHLLLCFEFTLERSPVCGFWVGLGSRLELCWVV